MDADKYDVLYLYIYILYYENTTIGQLTFAAAPAPAEDADAVEVVGSFGLRVVWRRGAGTEFSSEKTLFRLGLHTVRPTILMIQPLRFC